MSWPQVSIKEFCQTASGGTPSRKVAEYYGGSIPWIKSGDLRENIVTKASEYITELAIKNSSANLVPKDSILLAMYGATVGRMAMLGIEAATNQAVCSIIPNPNRAYTRYVYYALLSKVPFFLRSAVGGAQPNISQGLIKDTKIPLPSLEEQKRIAAILDKADALRRKRQQAIDLADQFLRSVFLEMFGDPVTNPKGWPEKPLAHGINTIESGWSASGENSPAVKDQLGVLKISAVTSGFFRPEENKAIEVSNVPAGKKLLKPRAGDLLFSRANTRELVAATAIVNQDYDNLFLPDKLWRVGTNEKMLPEFLHFLLKQPRMRDRLTSQATGTSGSMLNISKKKFEATPVIFPSAEEQLRFGEVFRKTRDICASEGQSVEEINLLFSSLSQQAFRGEL